MIPDYKRIVVPALSIVLLMFFAGAYRHFQGNLLIEAAKDNDYDSVVLLLDLGISPDVKDAGGQTSLIWAANKGYNRVAEALVQRGADVNAANLNGTTALLWAGAGGNQEMVELLLTKGADIEKAESSSGLTPLMAAAAQGHFGIVKTLLERKADPSTKDGRGNTAFTYAKAHGHNQVVQALSSRTDDVPNRVAYATLYVSDMGTPERIDMVHLIKGPDDDLLCTEAYSWTNNRPFFILLKDAPADEVIGALFSNILTQFPSVK